jgi:N6-adenosine-specific RNA methylase IME4
VAEVPRTEVDLPTDEDVASHIFTLNLDRRDLNASQTAVVTVLLGLGNSQQGARTDLRQNCRKLPVSEKYMQYARTACDPHRAIPEISWAVLGREITVAEAAEIVARLPIEEQAKAYRDSRAGHQSFKTLVGNALIVARNARLSAQALPNGPFPVIYADPGWQFDGETPLNPRAIVSRYKVESIDDVCALPVKEIVTPDAWLFLWTTVAHRLPAAAQVVPAWGFDFVDEIIWRKNVVGLGRVVRHGHEVLLICRRGNPMPPPTDAVPHSVIDADVEQHSKKPDRFRDVIKAMTPNLVPRLEMFARGEQYPGFVAWGNQAVMPEEAAA